jgi:ataxia telangiectasia mutated family protein
MAQISLAEALERVDSTGVKDRVEALADLKHVLRHNQRSSSIESLADASFHRIYEVLFKIIVSEQSAYAKAKTAPLKSGAANRLSACAGVLRLAVEVGVGSVKLKTVKALLDHFIETIPLAGGEVCEPLAQDYPKAMRAILAYPPHVAHLPKTEWERAAKFCLNHTQPAQSESYGGAASLGAEVTFMSSRSSRSRLNNSAGSQAARGPARQVAEEMVACLRMLTSAPNAPVTSTASETLWSMVSFLQATTPSNPAHQDAFGTIGNVLAWTKTENIQVTREVTPQLIRLIRTYWGAKTSGMKEVLTVFTHLQMFVRDQCSMSTSEPLRLDLYALLDTIRSDYSKRHERDQLHLEDIRFGGEIAAREQPGSVKLGILSLQCVGLRAEQTWTTVYIMAFVTSLLRETRKEPASDDEDEDRSHSRPRKRQRITNELDDILSCASSGTVGVRITALQTLAFMLQQSAMSPSQLNNILGSLLGCCNDENATTVSWALVAITSCAYQAASSANSLHARWTSLWQLACRFMTNASNCRAACGVLCIMIRGQLAQTVLVSELYQTLAVAFELSGPNILCDTSLEFVRMTMAHSVSVLPSSASAISNSVVGWLLRRWLPSKFDERSYAASCNLFNNADVVSLLAQYLGQSSHLTLPGGFPVWDVIGRTWLCAKEHEQLIAYLLSSPESESFVRPGTSLILKDATTTTRPKSSSEALIMNHLIGELMRAVETWKQIVHDRPQGITVDVFSALCHFLATSTCMAHCVRLSEHRLQSQLQQHCLAISKATIEYVTSDVCGQEKVDIMLTSFAQNIWPPTLVDQHDDPSDCIGGCRHALSLTITSAMSSRNASQYTHDAEDEEDMVDMANSYASQEGRRGRPQVGAVEIAEDSSITYSALALRATLSLFASITTVTDSPETLSGDEIESPSTRAVDIILELPETSILASRAVIANLPSLVPTLTTSDTERLLEYLTDNVLRAYPFERSEVAVGTILDAMIGLKSFWIETSNKNLADLGLDMYDWCVSTALKAGVLSPSVQKKVATLLHQLCHVNTEYGHDDGVPSVRTSLFDLLKRGAITVQFHLAQRISTIFGLYVLSTHDAMFDDLQKSLPTEYEWIEGLAMRLLFLAKLASSWHSLLRQSVYYIFETAGRVETSKPYAGVCIKEVAASLRFDSPRKLFRLFVPQLLHTWLGDNHPLEELPFATFGFDSLHDLLVDVQTEATAQLLMRGLDDDMQIMAETLNIEIKDLLRLAFSKSVAYAISRDIVLPHTDASARCEPRLRAIIGKEEYRQLSSDQFATIMGHFFLCMNQDDVEDSWLGKHGGYESATKALKDIKDFSYSTRPMPPPQQPSFRSRHLTDQLERFCKRTSQDAKAPWESSTFAVAARMLFDTLDPALGSQHSCTVLRKIRVLIATAGEVAVTGYSLEMLLRGIRPYLTDSQCADDALGILKYLMRRGKPQLSGNTKFMCGVLTVLLLETRAHMGTKQDSTTQETQHRETVQKMTNFYSFSIEYLQEAQKTIEARFSADYKVLVNALSHLQLPGNAHKGSPESTLLLLLVRQDGTSNSLFELGDVNAALAILTRNFQAPQSIADDVLLNDALCVESGPALWRTIQVSKLDNQFVLWAGKVIGRAYAASGDYTLYPKKRVMQQPQALSDNLLGAQRPYALIVRRLCEMVLSPTRTESGLAEYALRTVAADLVEDSADEVAFKGSLPGSLAPSIMRGTYGYMPPAMPKYDVDISDRQALKASLAVDETKELSVWVRSVALILCRWPSAPSLLAALPALLLSFQHLALELLPDMVHMVLEIEAENKQILRPELSLSISKHLEEEAEALAPKQDYLLDLVLYMRRQPYPKEHTKVDRLRWLEIDYMRAAETATKRSKPTFALMLAESSAPPVQANRRASSRASSAQQLPVHVPETMLLSIFEQVDEPDSFYGVEQPASLESVLSRLDYEKAGFKSLMFRSAQVDSHMRQSGKLGSADALGMVRSLSSLNLSSLTYALTSGQVGSMAAAATDEMLDSARKLQQWDIPLPESSADGSSRLLTIYQELGRAVKLHSATTSLDKLTLEHVEAAQHIYATSRPSRAWFNCLGLIAESADLACSASEEELLATWSRLQTREKWMEKARFEDFDLIQQGRITIFSVLGRNEQLLTDLHVSRNLMRISEVQALLSYSSLARQHSQLQTALCAATQVNDLSQDLQLVGIHVDAAAKHEVASVLWDSQESTASVKMLRDTLLSSDFEHQDIPVGRSDVLAQLGKQLADARLEKPSDILENYLRPAISHLPKSAVGREAGRVYHAFAAFCDQQLQHPANLEDYNRITTLRQRKLEEVMGLQELVKGTKRAAEKKEHERSFIKAQSWYKLDDEEFQHQKKSRETFLQQSLQNYLLALQASDEHDLSVLRFFALWLESSESAPANAAVNKHLPGVPSWKFVVLLNQLMSRLQGDNSAFQVTLSALLMRLCLEHPYHSVHHVYASTRPPGTKDEATESRYNAALNIRRQVSAHKVKGELFRRLFGADSVYRSLAEEPLYDKRTGKRALKDMESAARVARKIPEFRLPPVTIGLSLRPDGNYNDVPHVVRFGSTVSIMSGLSSPKVLTAISSDGQQYRQLFKSGNDDLRQDAIMEQVFEEVSKMLQNHKATRQRDLHIRTYKVLPLSPTAGIIEFVPNSIPINEFLNPAHAKYGPQDMKNNAARDKIKGVQGHSTETRVKEFRKVCDHLQPVMRHFFLERFDDPDDWFEKRTAYTRTTASVSMLGHVLGLGDRHGHNIMLDEVTGEVVHIDLGVAFEAGRVLPVPELVPFRLTRDIVDGMGVNKTEGIFRRCCEFTMDALREDKDSIMTLLNVLRYDPLYNWTLSPLRAKRMQDAQDGVHNAKDVEAAESSKAKLESEGGEADRALAIVEKKLSKTLSTAATVNELIQQATDEKNLATLFAGWAAWF